MPPSRLQYRTVAIFPAIDLLTLGEFQYSPKFIRYFYMKGDQSKIKIGNLIVKRRNIDFYKTAGIKCVYCGLEGNFFILGQLIRRKKIGSMSPGLFLINGEDEIQFFKRENLSPLLQEELQLKGKQPFCTSCRLKLGKYTKKIRNAIYPVEDILELIEVYKHPKNLIFPRFRRYRRKKSFLMRLNNKTINPFTRTLRLFKLKGVTCKHCGILGQYFCLEMDLFGYNRKWMLTLYALNDNCEEIRMTIDHIIPQSRGGDQSSLGNLQVLCEPCNQLKSDEI